MQDLKLTVASSKVATQQFHLLPVENVGNKKLSPLKSLVILFLKVEANFHLEVTSAPKPKHSSI